MNRAMGYLQAYGTSTSAEFSPGKSLPPHVYLGSPATTRKWELGLENILRTSSASSATTSLPPVTPFTPAKPVRAHARRRPIRRKILSRGSFGADRRRRPPNSRTGDRVRTRNINPADPHPPAALCPRPLRRGRAHSWVACFSGRGRDRKRRGSALALHRGVRRARVVGRGRRSDRQGLDRRLGALSGRR